MINTVQFPYITDTSKVNKKKYGKFHFWNKPNYIVEIPKK